ncbi:phage tail tape measure protein [Stenotrophomonas tuberculopleuritidis]|uniref:phage tail tape measure protein n=1 Tax=Stenotrophomonas tuberculopleuritidis TaxID=3055079 RepID=UPI0026E539B2|nr:phage tail tape measure protein [Stenotrophomonas sp. 704A1]
MSDIPLGVARVDIEVNSNLGAATQAAKRSLADMTASAQQQYQQLDRAERARLQMLLQQSAQVDRTRIEQEMLNAVLKSSAVLINEMARQMASNERAMRAARNEMRAYRSEAEALASTTDNATASSAGASSAAAGSSFLDQLGKAGELKGAYENVAEVVSGLVGRFPALANPMAAAAAALAAAVGGVAIAWNSASAESSSFERSLLIVGDRLNVNEAQLTGYAQAMRRIDGITMSEASEALSQVAMTGQFAGDELRLVAQAALQWQEAGVSSAEEVIASFVKIKQNPVAALKELEQQTDVLTFAQQQQIQSLIAQGNQADASALLMQAYAGKIGEVAPKVIDSATLMEGAWRRAKIVFSDLWDMVKEPFRADSVDDLRKNLADAESSVRRWSYTTLDGTTGSSYSLAEYSRAKKEAEEALRALQKNLKPILIEATVPPKPGQARTPAPNPGPPSIAPAQTIASPPSVPSLFDQIQEQIDQNERQRLGMDKLSASERLQRQAKLALKDATEDGNVTAAQRLELALKNLQASEQQLALHSEEVAATTQLEKLNRSLMDAEEARRKANEQELLGLGHGKEAAARLGRVNGIQREYEQGMKALRDSGIPEDSRNFRQQSDALRSSRDRRLSDEQDYQGRRMEEMGDWRNGARSAFDDYSESASNTAGMTQELFSKAFKGAEDALTKFVLTGKLNFSDLADSIITDLARIAAQQALMGIINSVVGVFAGSMGAGAGSAPSTGFAAGFGNNTGWLSSGNMTPNALGGVYASPSLSAYSGGVYNTPQLFAFAKGAGVFGEAGPEAIMPLRRGPDGRLGVAAHGGGGSGGVGVSIRIDNNGGKEVTTNESMLQQFGNEIGQFVERKYRELQSRDLKAGGVLSRSAMQ